jgi:hypothetical protein
MVVADSQSFVVVGSSFGIYVANKGMPSEHRRATFPPSADARRLPEGPSYCEMTELDS